MISKELLVGSGTCTIGMAAKWADALNAACDRYEINTPNRIAGFLSQVGHESAGFQFVVENLNYSSAGLMSVFGKYFPTLDLANAYARQPEKIANRVYANRMGNGDEASGDGWRHRGRGPIQLTGKDNYAAFSLAADVDVLMHPELLEQPEVGALAAGWYWNMRHLNDLADAGDVLGMTRRINGGTNGLDDRQARYTRIQDYMRQMA
jgi:putative chitinase